MNGVKYGTCRYCDGVLKLPLVAEWLQLINSNRDSGLGFEFSPDMNREVKEFYFRRCVEHFHSPPTCGTITTYLMGLAPTMMLFKFVRAITMHASNDQSTLFRLAR